jgi:two-component system cell cycle sensor histidine kinase/response regulator CckA
MDSPSTERLPAEGPPAPRRYVLVIDDEQPVREALSDILEMDGVPVLSAADGREGVAMFAQHHDEVGLVILDLVMPVMGGAETLRQLRQVAPSAKILLSSGYDECEMAQRLVEQPSAFLQKPYDLDAVLAKVHALL